jgi:3-oxoacyl-[acyl-carrier-protein] synthase III
MHFHFGNVCLESFGYSLPDEIVTSDEIEARLAPLYRRLRLPEGRLELMTGIRERRFWPRGMLPSEQSVVSGRRAMEQAGIDPAEIGVLVHASVSRDFIEPATACGVHRGLGLAADCLVYDCSNACLGMLNGIVQVAGMIELGQVRAGLVVGTECGRSLVETTIERLNADTALTRDDVKLAVASLTIGSGSAAVLLTDRELSRAGNRLRGGFAATDTRHSDLCQGAIDQRFSGMLMSTDSERLLHAGVALARSAFVGFLAAVDWTTDDLDKTVCHQVGSAHRKLMFQGLGLDTGLDFSSFEWLGNTGAVAVPLTAALAAERGHLAADDHLALLGIGSGINVLMLGVDWRQGRSPSATTSDNSAVALGRLAESRQPAI